MPDQLHWNTVRLLLKDVLTTLMLSDIFRPFRLVGGTSLSLQLGHRKSDDIDLFTDEPYGSVDFAAIDHFLRRTFPYVSDPVNGPVGLGSSYLVGNNPDDTVKLDIYYTDPFVHPAVQINPYRLAMIDEIIAMKLDIVQRRARKKDFWDLHEMLGTHTSPQMIALHALRYPYNHDEALIRTNFTDFSHADKDFDPICLRGKYWELIKLDIIQAFRV